MQFGICTSIDNAQAVQAAGGDFVEENVQNFITALVPDQQWNGLARFKKSPLPLPAANVLVSPTLKITGPDANLDLLKNYTLTVMRRSRQVGIEILVFGSGTARNVPEGFDRSKARRQILDFIAMAADLAAEHGITLVAEHMNRGESNIINSLAEAMEYVREAKHPHFQCLVDSYHFWLEKEPLEDLRTAMPWIRHVHLSDPEGRVAPGQSGKVDYKPLFKVLKDGGYDRRMAIESPCWFKEIPIGDARATLDYLRKEWKDA